MTTRLDSQVEAISRVLLGKQRSVRLALSCLLAGGHLLLEDLPGTGKTTLAEALARSFGLAYRRVSFTSDLLPADLTGINVLDPASGSFRFQPGPLFTQVLLADEINRASPRTQSALLEAMEERQVSTEGATRPLPQPFFVIATQNPSEQLGTHALPESQLDRFLMRIRLDYPDREAERALLLGEDRRAQLAHLPALLDTASLQALQAEVGRVAVAPAAIDYLQDLLAATRNGRWFVHGLSPRAGLGLLRAARAHALLAGRHYVAPDDLAAILPQTAAHRLLPVGTAGRGAAEQVRAMLDATPLP